MYSIQGNTWDLVPRLRYDIQWQLYRTKEKEWRERQGVELLYAGKYQFSDQSGLEVIHKLVERQALRRVEGGALHLLVLRACTRSIRVVGWGTILEEDRRHRHGWGPVRFRSNISSRIITYEVDTTVPRPTNSATPPKCRYYGISPGKHRKSS